MDAKKLEQQVGHPARLQEQLIARVQDQAVKRFSDVEDEWLTLMWSIDAFRIARLTPHGMGKGGPGGFGGVYRGKGNWFATVLSLLLNNQTGQVIRPRTNVQGFSQLHQVDLAWPARQVDPLICAESKVTGAPAYAGTPARGAMSDWSNRRKELKFAATDLKLARRQQETKIEHWDDWRTHAPPQTFFLWAGRLDPSRHDSVDKLVREARALVDTYLDGAGVFAWHENSTASGYEPVPLPTAARVSDLDDVLYKIASVINRLAGPGGKAPDPVTPAG